MTFRAIDEEYLRAFSCEEYGGRLAVANAWARRGGADDDRYFAGQSPAQDLTLVAVAIATCRVLAATERRYLFLIGICTTLGG